MAKIAIWTSISALAVAFQRTDCRGNGENERAWKGGGVKLHRPARKNKRRTTGC